MLQKARHQNGRGLLVSAATMYSNDCRIGYYLWPEDRSLRVGTFSGAIPSERPTFFYRSVEHEGGRPYLLEPAVPESLFGPLRGPRTSNRWKEGWIRPPWEDSKLLDPLSRVPPKESDSFPFFAVLLSLSLSCSLSLSLSLMFSLSLSLSLSHALSLSICLSRPFSPSLSSPLCCFVCVCTNGWWLWFAVAQEQTSLSGKTPGFSKQWAERWSYTGEEWSQVSSLSPPTVTIACGCMFKSQSAHLKLLLPRVLQKTRGIDAQTFRDKNDHRGCRGIGVPKTGASGKPCLCPPPKRGGFDENGDKKESEF